MALVLRPCRLLPAVTVMEWGGGGASAPSHQQQGGWSGIPGPPLQDLSAAVWGDLGGVPPPGPLLCCAAPAVFCLHGLGSLSLCLLCPVTTVQDFPRCHCPLFYVLSFTLALPAPCKVYIAPPLHGVRGPPPHEAGSLHAHPSPWAPAPLPSTYSAAQTWKRDRILYYGLQLGGRGPT